MKSDTVSIKVEMWEKRDINSSILEEQNQKPVN